MSNETKARPYTTIQDEQGWHVVERGKPFHILTFTDDEPHESAEFHAEELNRAFSAGQASREHSPDIVERTVEAVSSWAEFSFVIGGIAPHKLQDLRTRITPLLNPQP